MKPQVRTVPFHVDKRGGERSPLFFGVQAMETEHKYLVEGDFRPFVSETLHIIQGYLSDDPCRTVRVRVVGDRAFLTVKGASSESGLSRYEWEKEIPREDGLELLRLCLPGIIDKHRHIVCYCGWRWEVDEFHGSLEGLVLAELEVDSEDTVFDIPPFVGKEVTGEAGYYNSQLRKAACR